LDVFTRNEYKNILLDSLHYCQKEKGLEVFAWCIMTSHVHLVFRSSKEGIKPEQLLGDFKRFTSKTIIKAIKDNPSESLKEFLLDQFQKAGAMDSNVVNYQCWRHDNKPRGLCWRKRIIG
jgi:REP element-mobilizing transposase RayT